TQGARDRAGRLLRPGATPRAAADRSVPSGQELVELMRAALAGLPVEPTASVCRPPRDRPIAPGPIEPLSEREVEVLRLVAEGLPNKEVAARLIVATGTVKAHLHNICGKLEATNRTGAVARARELGLL